MTPLYLQQKLNEEVRKALANLELKNPVSTEADKPVQVFDQHLPNKEKSKDRFPEHSLFPNVIIRMQQGEQHEAEEQIGVRVIFVACVYDTNDDNQGYQDVMTIIEKLYQHFSKRPLVGDRYQIQYPIRWDYQDEDTEPYFFCSLDTTWAMPTVRNEQVEALI